MLSDQLIINLFLILTVAWAFGSLFAHFGLPVVLGELTAGLILGPTLLGVISGSEPIEFMAELGIFFLMFYAGLEMDPEELLEHMKPAIMVALGGFVLPFVLGYFFTRFFGGTQYQSLFMGMGLSVTSLAVQARILHDMQIQKTKLGHIIIGAAIADDIMALITLSLLLGIAESGSIEPVVVGLVLVKVVAFFGAVILLSHFVLGRLNLKFDSSSSRDFTFALLSALVLAFFAELAGLHLIIGAFVAGQFVRKLIRDPASFENIRSRVYALSYGFLAPIFFVTLSFHLHLSFDISLWVFTGVVTVIAIIGKLVGCGLGARVSGHSFWESNIIGFGMNGRGAVELVVAMVVIKLSDELMAAGTITEALLTTNQFSALILMAFITTFIAPITLKWGLRKACQKDEHADFCVLWDKYGRGRK